MLSLSPLILRGSKHKGDAVHVDVQLQHLLVVCVW